jgi:hypothetical protein
MKLNRIVIAAGILITLLIIALAIISTHKKNMEKSHMEELNKLDKEKAKLESLMDTLKFQIKNDMRIIREKDEVYDELEEKFKKNQKYYNKIILDLRNNPVKVKEVIYRETGGDSTKMAVKLIERLKCLEDNKLITSQNDVLLEKIIIQDTVIYKMEQVINLKDLTLLNSNNKIIVYKKENDRLNRKLKASKITNKILIGLAGVVGGFFILK